MIVWAEDRPSAIDRMLRALSETTIEGVKTTLPLLRRILRNSYFVKGDYTTHFLDTLLAV